MKSPTTMLAARLHAPGDLRLEEMPVPTPGPGEILVKIEACGICGSDLPRIFTTGTYHYPTVPGHEFMGQVVCAGEGVENSIIGRRAAVLPLIGCGTCEMCRAGLPFHCAAYGFLGSRSDGGFAQYVVAPAGNLVFVQDHVPSATAALLEPMTVGLHSVRRPGVEVGDTVVVFGAGGIGLFAAQAARLCGAGRVIQVDIREEALARARACGVDLTLNARDCDIVETVRRLTSGRGADLAVEAAGAAQSTADAFRCVRRRGRISLIGRMDAAWTMPEDVLSGLMRKEQTLFGNWGFDSCPFPADDWAVVAQALDAGRLVAEPIVSHTFPLERLHDAFALIREGRELFCKVMIAM